MGTVEDFLTHIDTNFSYISNGKQGVILRAVNGDHSCVVKCVLLSERREEYRVETSKPGDPRWFNTETFVNFEKELENNNIELQKSNNNKETQLLLSKKQQF